MRGTPRNLTDGDTPGFDRSRRTFVYGVGLVGVVCYAIPVQLFAYPDGAAASGRSVLPFPVNNQDSEEGTNDMPFVRIDAFEGRSDAEVKKLLDVAHAAIVKAFHINERDRYQIYTEHKKQRFIMQDTGLNIPRTDNALIITVTSKTRAEILKRRFYTEMTDALAKGAGVLPSDVMMCIIENGAADWTFGNGDPQFLTGELP